MHPLCIPHPFALSLSKGWRHGHLGFYKLSPNGVFANRVVRIA
jgi:hypothetical protein